MIWKILIGIIIVWLLLRSDIFKPTYWDGRFYPDMGDFSIVIGKNMFDSEQECEQWAEDMADRYGVVYSGMWAFECNKERK